MSQPAASSRIALIAFVVTTLVWGSTWLVITGQLSSVPPAWSVTWRFMLAGAAMFGLAAVRGERLALDRSAWGLAGVVGFFQFFANFQLVYQAERFITSGLVAVLFALLIVPNAALGWLVNGTRVNQRFVIGSGIAIAGIALLMLHEYRLAPAAEAGGAGYALIGLGLTLGSVLSASIANVLQSGATARRTSIVVLLAWAMLAGTICDAVFALATAGSPRFDLSPGYMFGMAYLALVGSVVTFPLYSILLRDWGPGRAAYNGVLVPVVAMALSTLFEGYQWTLLAAAGAVVALAGLLVALSGRNKAPSPS